MNDKIEEVINHPLFVPAVVGLAGFASGLGLGFFLGRRQTELTTEFEIHEVDVVDLEVDETVEEVETYAPPTPVVIDEVVAKEKGIIKVDSLKDLSPSMVSDEPPPFQETLEPLEEITEEVAEEAVPEAEDGIEWDWQKELDARKDTEPYILHLEEFEAGELGFSKYSLTYYAIDEMVVDDQNVPVFNHSSVVGDLNFGHGSGQVDVVYVRNHERKAEYEITRLDQSYALEIHGLEVEDNERVKDLRHGKLQKFRQD